MNHSCNNHHIKMIKGKSQTELASINLGMPTFINIHCKECDKYLKHASHAELDAWEKMTKEEQDRVTYGQLHQICYEQVIVYDKNNPEEYINSFPKHTLWLNIPFAEKDEAKKHKAGLQWDPYIKVWHTNIFHKNVMKLQKWMFPVDIQRVTDYHNQSKEDRQLTLQDSFIKKRPDYEEVHPQSYWDNAYDEHMNNKLLTKGEA